MAKKTCKAVPLLNTLQAIQKLKLNSKPVLAMFGSEECGFCQQAKPEIQKASCVVEDEMEVVRIDIDENPLAASEYGIESLPTVAVIHRGKIISKIEGAAKSKEYVKQARTWLQENQV